MSRWTCGSSSRTRRGVNAADTSLRIRDCAAPSRARNDITRCASGFHALGSSVTPIRLENVSSSRNAAKTSSCRDSTQKSPSSL